MFARAANYVEKTIREKTLRFYPVSVWSLWTGQMRVVSGLMKAVAKLVGLTMTKPGGEVVEDSEGSGVDAKYFRRVSPADAAAMAAWTDQFAAAVGKAWEELTKDDVLETFVLLILDSLKEEGPVTREKANALARNMDLDVFIEMAMGFTEASLKGMATPLKLALTKWIDTAVKTAKKTANQMTPTSQQSETM